MRSRLGLVALWAVFAAASVGVGFGAAGLVGDPFTGPGGDAVPLSEASGAADSGTATPASPTPDPSTSAGSGGTTAGTGADRPVVRSLSTRAGLVSGSCSRGLVTVSASPAVGWALDDVDGGPTTEARVRFARTGDRDGRVEVRARCAGAEPRFTQRDDAHGGGPDSTGGSGGGDDSGGSDGSGGPGPG